MNEHLKTVINCIKAANENGAEMERNDVLTGYSGASLFGTLQRLTKESLSEGTCYLEVGVYQGLTLLSSAMNSPKNVFYGIDNFAFFDKDGKNEGIIKERIKKLNISNAHLINKDYEDGLENLSSHIGDKKVGVYFIDGPHDYRSQLMCLMLIKPYLAEKAVILIDDSNYRHVRQANRDFLITNPEFKLLYQSYTKAHPMNLSTEDKKESEKNWWNGINVIYKDTDNELDVFYPETTRDRSLYENEHILHSSKFPDQLLAMIGVFKKYKLFYVLNYLVKPKKMFVGKYSNGNTYSEELPTNVFNKAI